MPQPSGSSKLLWATGISYYTWLVLPAPHVPPAWPYSACADRHGWSVFLCSCLERLSTVLGSAPWSQLLTLFRIAYRHPRMTDHAICQHCITQVSGPSLPVSSQGHHTRLSLFTSTHQQQCWPGLHQLMTGIHGLPHCTINLPAAPGTTRNDSAHNSSLPPGAALAAHASAACTILKSTTSVSPHPGSVCTLLQPARATVQ